MSALSDQSRAKLLEAAVVMEGLAKERLGDVSALRAKHNAVLKRLQDLRDEITKIEAENAVAPDHIQAEARKARFLYDQANALRAQADDLKVPNHWVEKAEAVLARLGLAKAFRIENAAYTASLLALDVIPAHEGVKIATIICHAASVGTNADGGLLFSVAGYRTKNGSPNVPFEGLEAALHAATQMERWGSEDNMFIHLAECKGTDALGRPVPREVVQ